MGYADAVAGLGPTSFWRLDDTSWAANSIKDSTTNSHHASGSGTTFTLGQPAVPFGERDPGLVVPSQTPGGEIRVPQAAWMESVSVTWAVPLNVATSPPSDRYSVVSRRQYGGGGPYAFYIEGSANANSTPTTQAGGCAALVCNTNGAFSWGASTGISVCDGKPHLVVHTITTSGSNSISTCYLDGVQTGQVTISGPMPMSGSIVNGSDMCIGGEGPSARGLNGSLDDVAFWAGTALSQASISLLWSAFVRGGVSY